MTETLTSRIHGDLPLRDAREAADSIDEDAVVLVSGFGSVGYPKDVPLALAEDERDLSLTIVSGGSVGEEIDTKLVQSGAVARRCPYQARSEVRSRINAGAIDFHDPNVSELADEVRYGRSFDPDVAVVEAVAVGEDWLIPSTSIGHTPAFVEAADELVVEVNEAQPLALQAIHDCYSRGPPPTREAIPLDRAGGRIGSPRVSFAPNKLSAVVRTDRPDTPYSFREPTETDVAIADNLGSFLESEVRRTAIYDEAIHVQFGVGSLGNALMSAIDSADFGSREVVYFGEVIQDGLLDMIEDGNLTSASAASLALSERGQSRFFDDVERYAEHVVLRPADISNSPALIGRFGVVAVNSALEVDVYGHANSTHVNGTHVMNGIGGSADFTRNSPCAIMALPSTAGDGDISKIVPMVPHADHTEHDVDVIVTEHGVADLRGISPRDRATSVVEHCAAPQYRPQLREYLDRAAYYGGHIRHDLARSLEWPRKRQQ